MPRLRSHPGRVLKAELEARGVSANQLALKIRVPANRITSLLREERAETPETALRLGRYLGTGAAFWMNLQTAYDISEIEARKGRAIEEEVPVARDRGREPDRRSAVDRRAGSGPGVRGALTLAATAHRSQARDA